jgi:hypothetical protein
MKTNTICQGALFDQRTLNGIESRAKTIDANPLKSGNDHRLKLKTQEVINKVRGLLRRADANLGSYSDTEAQRELMKSIASRVNDAAMLALLEAWLEIACERKD